VRGARAGAATGTIRIQPAASGGTASAGARAEEGGRDAAQTPDNAGASVPVNVSTTRRVRLGSSRDRERAGDSQDRALRQGLASGSHARGDGSSVTSSMALENSPRVQVAERQSLDAGASLRRPGSSAGLRPRSSSSSWRPVLSVQEQSGGADRSRHGESGRDDAGRDVNDDDVGEIMPAEDPYVRLLREREREWRGRTLQMMSGTEDDDGGLLVDRYIRLGR
jgi:hypothetical protein